MEIKINKEIRAYRETLFFGLSVRQFVCSVLAVGAAVGLYFSLSQVLDRETVSWVCIVGAAPVAAAGFFQYNGLTLERFLWAWLKSEVIMAGKRVWKGENYYEEAIETRGEEALMFFKQHRSAERDAFSVPHSVQKSIPIKRIYQDGVFQVSGKFSKTWRFFDVNYAVASPEKQRELFMTYCSFLNSLPIGATAKITLFNRQLNQKDFGRTLLMPMQGDRRDLYRNEYNALVLGKAAESNNLIQEKYITVSAEKKSVEEARAFFSRVGTDLTTGLSRMSSSVREITVNDRLRLLHDFYRPGEEQLFRFNLEDTMRKGA